MIACSNQVWCPTLSQCWRFQAL